MKKIGLFLLLGVSLSWLVSACQGRQQEVTEGSAFGFYCAE